jgi:hypothetical protein
VCRFANSLEERSESTWKTAWRIGGWSLVNGWRDGKTSLIAVTWVMWREMRVAGRAFSTSLGHVKARYSFGHARIPTVRTRPDIRRTLALFVCGVAVGVAGVVLLIPRVPSVMTFAMRIGGATLAQGPHETPSSAPKVPEAPIPRSASLPADASSGEPNRADRNVPFRRLSAAPRPAPVSSFRGSLAVSSSPQGAQVFVNGVSVGVTPLLLRNMPVGSRAVRVELDGHERWSSAVRIVASQRTLAAAKLLPLSIRSSGSGAGPQSADKR